MQKFYILRILGASLGCAVISVFPLVNAAEEEPDVSTELKELREQVKELSSVVAELQKQLAAQQANDVSTDGPELFPDLDELPEPTVPEKKAEIGKADEGELVDDTLPPPPPELLSGAADEVADSPREAGEPDLFTDLSASETAGSLPQLPSAKRTDLSVFNPEISAVLDVVGSYSRSARNFNLIGRDVELMLQSNVDQLARAYIVFNAESELEPWEKSDIFNEAHLGLEEAAIETTALPYGLVAKAGVFFADFTRLGKVHTHELPFTDRPASLSGIIGGEARSRGIELNWVPPTGHYFRLTAGAVDNIGAEDSVTQELRLLNGHHDDLFEETDRRSLSNIMYYARAATVFELSDQVSLNIGTNYARGKEYGRRSLFGADFKLTWLPDPQSYDSFILGGEYLCGKSNGDFAGAASFLGGPTSGSSNADGAYLYAQYNRGKHWEATLRYDWFRPKIWQQTAAVLGGPATGVGRHRETQHSISAYLGYKFSEFNRLRLGVAHFDGLSGAYDGKNSDTLGFLQWTITLGPHKHAYQP